MRYATSLWSLQEYMLLLLCAFELCAANNISLNDNPDHNSVINNNDENAFVAVRLGKFGVDKPLMIDIARTSIKKFENEANQYLYKVTYLVRNYSIEMHGLEQFDSQFMQDFVDESKNELSIKNTSIIELLQSITGKVKQLYHITVGNSSDLLKTIDEGVQLSIKLSFESIDNYTKSCRRTIKDLIKFYGNVTADVLAEGCAEGTIVISRFVMKLIIQLSDDGNKLVTGLLTQGSNNFKELAIAIEDNLYELAKHNFTKEDIELANSSANDLKLFENTIVTNLEVLSNKITEQMNTLKNYTIQVMPLFAESKANSVIGLIREENNFNVSSRYPLFVEIEKSAKFLYEVYHVLPKESYVEIKNIIDPVINTENNTTQNLPNDVLPSNTDDEYFQGILNNNRSHVPNRTNILITNYTKEALVSFNNITKFLQNYNMEINGLKDYNSEIIITFVDNAINDVYNKNTTSDDLINTIIMLVNKFYNLTIDNVYEMLLVIESGIKDSVNIGIITVDEYAKTCYRDVQEEIQFYGHPLAEALAEVCGKNVKTILESTKKLISTFSETGNTLVTGLLQESTDSLKKFTVESEEKFGELVKLINLSASDKNSDNSSVEDIQHFSNLKINQFKNVSTRISEQINSLNQLAVDVLPFVAEVKAYLVTNLTDPKHGGANFTGGNFNLKQINRSVEIFHKRYHVIPADTFAEINRFIDTSIKD